MGVAFLRTGLHQGGSGAGVGRCKSGRLVLDRPLSQRGGWGGLETGGGLGDEVESMWQTGGDWVGTRAKLAVGDSPAGWRSVAARGWNAKTGRWLSATGSVGSASGEPTTSLTLLRRRRGQSVSVARAAFPSRRQLKCRRRGRCDGGRGCV